MKRVELNRHKRRNTRYMYAGREIVRSVSLVELLDEESSSDKGNGTREGANNDLVGGALGVGRGRGACDGASRGSGDGGRGDTRGLRSVST